MKNKTAKKERDKKETQSAHLAAAPIGGDDKKLLDEVLKTYSGLSREKARAIGEASASSGRRRHQRTATKFCPLNFTVKLG